MLGGKTLLVSLVHNMKMQNTSGLYSEFSFPPSSPLPQILFLHLFSSSKTEPSPADCRLQSCPCSDKLLAHLFWSFSPDDSEKPSRFPILFCPHFFLLLTVSLGNAFTTRQNPLVFLTNPRTKPESKPKPPTQNAGIVSCTARLFPRKGCLVSQGATAAGKNQIRHRNPGEFAAQSGIKETASLPG